MSIETNDDDQSHQMRDTARQTNGNEHAKRNGGLSGGEGELTYDMNGEDGEDEIYARRKSVPGLTAEESRKSVVHSESSHQHSMHGSLAKAVDLFW